MAEQQAEKEPEEVRKKQFVLVVDGNARDALVTGMLLQNFGYTVTTVKTTDEALEFIAIAVPSLIVMELDLPASKGRDLLVHLRQVQQLTSIPIIAQTSGAAGESEALFRDDDNTQVLRKPVSAENLYRAVQATIEPTPRQNLRVSTYLRASVDGAGQGAELITVISDNGVFIKTLTPRPVGSAHSVSFMISRRIIKVEAEVLYTYAFGEGPNKDPGMGMRFTVLRTEDREFIQQFIRQQVNPPLKPDR